MRIKRNGHGHHVPAGGVAEVTLTNRGGVMLRGRVVDLATRSPLPRFRCSLSPRAGDITLNTWLRVSDITDESGTFEMPRTPAGDIGVVCWPEDRGGYSSAALGLTVDATRVLPELELPAVRLPAGPRGLVGIRFRRGDLVARVDTVMSPGPAARAGLAAGDVVVAVDGVDTSRLSTSGVVALMNGHAPGTRLTVTVRRGAETKTVTMTTEAERDH